MLFVDTALYQRSFLIVHQIPLSLAPQAEKDKKQLIQRQHGSASAIYLRQRATRSAYSEPSTYTRLGQRVPGPCSMQRTGPDWKWRVTSGCIYVGPQLHFLRYVVDGFVEWLVEQGLTSHSTQFRSFWRRCLYRSDDPTNSVKALKEGG